jgi:hypothetical protein
LTLFNTPTGFLDVKMLVRFTHLRAEDLVERFGSAILADTVSVTDK